jgi:hypothetical protein
MSDGQRTITVVLTEAQYDVLQAALEIGFSQFQYQNRPRDRDTLMRASNRLHQGWLAGIKA